MNKPYELGKEGENISANHLKKNNYEIIHRNWRWNYKEIDIIAKKDNLLIIVEVKSRFGNLHEDPEDAVTLKKQRFIIDATEAYIEKYDINMEVRFDVMSIVFANKSYKIDHIEDAFTPLF